MLVSAFAMPFLTSIVTISLPLKGRPRTISSSKFRARHLQRRDKQVWKKKEYTSCIQTPRFPSFIAEHWRPFLQRSSGNANLVPGPSPGDEVRQRRQAEPYLSERALFKKPSLLNIDPRSEASREGKYTSFKNIKFPRGDYQTDSSET